MPDRRRQIELLLATRFDYTFEPETFTGKVVRRGATAGKATPSHWQTCPSCDGGSRRDRFGRLAACETCDGTGRQRVDDYTGAVVVTGEDRDVPMAELLQRDTRFVRCPDCQNLQGDATGVIRGQACRRCHGTGQAAIPGSWLSEPADPDRAGGDPLDAMLAAIERRNHVGSYHELDHALAALARGFPYRARLLDLVYLTRDLEYDRLVRHGQRLVDAAIAFIDRRMPQEIRVPADVTRNAQERAKAEKAKGQALTGLSRQRRDAQIRRWEREGKPRQWIAQQAGLSYRQLQRILDGTTEAA